jgi:hypothetical protein
VSGTTVTIAKALATVLTSALADLSMPVERERTEPLALADLPRVLVFEDGTGAEAEFIGGQSLRFLRFSVEAVANGASPAAAQDAVAVLRERCRVALEANRTLSGASLGLYVGEGAAARGDLPEQTNARGVALAVTCYHT